MKRLAVGMGAVLAVALAPLAGPVQAQPARDDSLQSIARDTWKFFDADTDATTHLPMDNIGLDGAPARGAYTSATNIGVYFWSVVAAQDLDLVHRPDALARADATLTEVEHLSKWHDTAGWPSVSGYSTSR